MIRSARKRAGLTQRALAAQAGTSQSAVARYEAGRAAPDIATLERLVEACGFRLDVRLATRHAEIPSDPHDRSLVELQLARTPEQRLADLTAWSDFRRRVRIVG